MKLTVVGCSGSVPGPDAATSCYLLETGHDGRTWRMVLDLGAGALGPLQRFCDPADLDAVALSHLHLDHYGDLAALHVYLRHHVHRATPVPVWGPEDTASALATLRRADSPSPVVQVNPWRVGVTQTMGPWEITAAPVVHSVEAYALKVTGPSSVTSERAALVYSGDTARCAALVDLARGADLLVGEASFPDSHRGPVGLHMTGREVGQVAAEAQVGRLVVSHVPPWHDPQRMAADAAGAFTGTVELAAPGRQFLL